MTGGNIHTCRDALRQELREIEDRRRRRAGDPSPAPRDAHEDYAAIAARLQPTALCLSGGGIRSASFCLGVLQILARKRLLGQFDYLSTVSGGGFIGGWLQVLIHDLKGVDNAEAALRQPRPDALRRLRAYTNYLTPQTGPLSTDTWTGIVLYLRNLLINWAVFAPLFLLITLIPISYRTAISLCSDQVSVNLLLLFCAGVSLLAGIICVCDLLPSHRPPRSATDPRSGYATAASIRWRVVYPAFGWTLLIPWLLDLANGPWDEALRMRPRPWLGYHAYWIVPVVYLGLLVLGFALAWALQTYRKNPGRDLFRINFLRWVLASLGSALLTWLLLSLAGSVLPLEGAKSSLMVDTATALTVFAPLALSVVHVLQTSLYVALRRETELADLDREWLGRVNAMILRLAAGWTVFALCCLVFPVLLDLVKQTPGHAKWSSGEISTLSAFTMALGGLAAWLGKIWPSIEKISEKPAIWDIVRAYLPVALGAVFVVCLLVVFGGVLHFVLAQLQTALPAALGFAKAEWLMRLLQSTWLPLLLQLVVGLVLLAGVLTFRKVNVNRFSMHGVYRNRLTRAFLGSARSEREREQEPLTGFDPKDNIPLSLLRNGANSLFPVINMTLNITAGNNTAWAERQAASFVATPLICGSAMLRHPSQEPTEVDPLGAFVATEQFAGLETLKNHPQKPTESGPGLGNALTVSGAAVSSTWGYHSSRITAFLMTLFNVRLGVWLPNPSKASPDDLRLARPRNSLKALIDEMLGETTDDSQAIYLSDGGHFENLGLYEMFRRRCSSILVVDAGADETCSLFDLGNAIRKAEIDLGIKVTMHEPMRVFARSWLIAESALNVTALGFASGRIEYDGEQSGTLLYIKPSYLQAIPADVRSYGADHTSFPHESTLDQWFSESQFESYRMLGQYQMEELVSGVEDGALEALFTEGAKLASRPPAPRDTGECAGMRTLASVIAGRFPPPDGQREAAD